MRLRGLCLEGPTAPTCLCRGGPARPAAASKAAAPLLSVARFAASLDKQSALFRIGRGTPLAARTCKPLPILGAPRGFAVRRGKSKAPRHFFRRRQGPLAPGQQARLRWEHSETRRRDPANRRTGALCEEPIALSGDGQLGPQSKDRPRPKSSQRGAA